MSSYAKITASTASLISIGLTKLIFFILVGRRFGDAILGQLSISYGLMMILSTIIGAGMASSATRIISRQFYREREKVSYTIGGYLLIVILESLIIIGILAIYIDELSSLMNIDIFFVQFSLIIAFSRTLYLLYKGYYYGIDAIKQYAKLELIVDFIFIFSLLFIIISFSGPEFALFPFLIMYTIFIILSIIFIRKRIHKIHFKKALTKDLISFGLIFTIGTSASTGMMNMGFIVGAFFITSSIIGQFSAALSIATISLMITQILNSVLMPLFAQLQSNHNMQRLVALYKEAERLSILTGIMICGIIIFSSELIIAIIYDSGYIFSANMLSILAIGTALSIAASPSVSLLTGSGISDVTISAISSLLAFCVALVSWIILIPLSNDMGLPIGLVLGLATQSTISMTVAHRRIKDNLNGKKSLNYLLLFPSILFLIFLVNAYLYSYSLILLLIFIIIMLIIFRNDFLRIFLSINSSLRELCVLKKN